MKIAFLIERNTYFRFLGVIIDEALRRGHEVFCLHDYSQPKVGSKGYQFPDIAQTPHFKNGKLVSLSYQNQSELKEKILQKEIKAVVSLEVPAIILNLQKELKEKGVYWVCLQNSFDIAFSGINMDKPDRFFAYTLTWTDWLFEYFKKTGKASREKIDELKKIVGAKVKFVGFWGFGQSNAIDKNEIRRKWGIPQSKKVFLLVPFPFDSSLKHFWARFVYGMDNKFLQLFLNLFNKTNKNRFVLQIKNRENDRQLVGSIREFCDKNNAFLLVKSRVKDPVRKYLAKMADKVLYDESFYPTTIMECLAVSDICLSFYSTVAMESACSGVPHICVAPAKEDWRDLQSPYFETIFEKMGDFFNFPGVSWKLSIPQAIKKLEGASFLDFILNENQLEKYHQKFIGDLSGNYAANVVDEIESL
ncbi:MAG: hypothetical protein PHY72_01645 [Candidatus Pacebacteria bacterium]|nr:hypothetical protein [Candidatus Paceibacterota bacterium]